MNSYGDKSLQDYMNNIPAHNPSVPSQPIRNSWESGLTKEEQGMILFYSQEHLFTVIMERRMSLKVLVFESLSVAYF